MTLVAGSMPIRQRFREAGVTGNDVRIFSGLMDAKSIFLTANAGTTYFSLLDDSQLERLQGGLQFSGRQALEEAYVPFFGTA